MLMLKCSKKERIKVIILRFQRVEVILRFQRNDLDENNYSKISKRKRVKVFILRFHRMKVIILKFQRESGRTCSVFSCRPDSWVINLERLQESLWNLNNSIKRKLLFNLHHSPQNLYIFYWLIKSLTHLGPPHFVSFFLYLFILKSINDSKA